MGMGFSISKKFERRRKQKDFMANQWGETIWGGRGSSAEMVKLVRAKKGGKPRRILIQVKQQRRGRRRRRRRRRSVQTL